MASLTDDNAAGDKIGGVESLISGRMEQYVIAKVKNCEGINRHWMAEAADAFISVNKMTI